METDKRIRDEYFKKWILGHLQGAFKSMRSDNSATITPLSLYRYLKNMNYKPRKGEIEEAIWEVDEDHDGEVCWEEFLRAFIRCIHDEKGVEPHQLHNIVLFSIFSDGTPVISDVNIRRMMHLKHGPDDLPSVLEIAFGSGPYYLTMESFTRGMSKLNSRKNLPSHLAGRRG